ncbi:MAG TPA: toll/interleukin-1 receptor domain-containing protein [Thermoanaerobaculia bacterium]|nr:toll/interleukin-1 receptor domain-containing protein [Thermoanaerobaculia bacterium]
MSRPIVFLSYSHEDRAWAKTFADALKEQGLALWFDEWELKPGDKLADAMEKALRESQALIFLLGPESLDQPALFFELGAAVALKKRIIPVVSEGVERSKIPGLLLHMRHVVRRDPEETAIEVAKAVA